MLEADVSLPDRLPVSGVTREGGKAHWGLDKCWEAGDGPELVPDHTPSPRAPRDHPGPGHGDKLRPGARPLMPGHRDKGALLTKLGSSCKYMSSWMLMNNDESLLNESCQVSMNEETLPEVQIP